MQELKSHKALKIMIFKSIKSFYILIIFMLSSFIGFFVEVGEANLLACGTPIQSSPQNSIYDSERVLQQIRNLKAPIVILYAGTSRCGKSISVGFTDAQGTDFLFGVDDSGWLYFVVQHPSDKGVVRLRKGYEEAQTILLNLLKDWLQYHSSNPKTEQDQSPNQLSQKEERHSQSLMQLIERVENKEKNLSSDGN